ncbi:DUF1707 and DUF2154 domain-containing protein [Thermobifida halotolerans]|uniref:DUF1707 and DUF2154 domain-containing protein n=1 Tax=Thermobifida halotolerans TaxID=483545 RepID=A0AA97LWE4_9ACTN|nr:DUF1707 domain-containing protein [Thermobifida halotolerans]UOE19201.1 DUF1707 and DUF2154 domain-containing protein [Thermobifida halotolerans]
MANILNHSQSAGPGPLRASDADRDRVARVLADALADGRLTQEEHSERLEAVYAAKTLGELAPLTLDLEAAPVTAAGDSTVQPHPSAEGVENIVAVFAHADRGGRWLVEPRTNTSTLFGSVSLELREAVLSQREVVIQCGLLFGSLELTVPPGVRVVNQVTPVFGDVSLKRADSAVPADAPTVRLTGTAIFSTVSVRTRARKEKKSKKSAWFC